MSETKLPRIYIKYLEEDPFDESDTRKIKYFYQSKQHIDAIERIHSGMKLYKQSLLLLTGEVGSGKTFTSTVIMTMLKNDKDEHGRKTNMFAPVFIEKAMRSSATYCARSYTRLQAENWITRQMQSSCLIRC